MNTTPIPAPSPFETNTDQFNCAKNVAGAVQLSRLPQQNIRWLWPGRIPLGRITLLVGDPGLGKSLLTLDIAARVSAGQPWPDEVGSPSRGGLHTSDTSTTPAPPESCNATDTKSAARLAAPTDSAHLAPNSSPLAPNSPLRTPHSTLLLSAEDDFADTVRPRLEALGANCDRIFGIASVPGDKPQDVPRTFALHRDLARLQSLLDSLPDCRLVVIDPINAYLGSTNADVQSLLHNLTTIARERDVAVLIVSQLRKQGGAAVFRALGSVAFVAAARASWAICPDPTDPNKRLLLPVKNNLSSSACGLAFTINSETNHPQIIWSPDPVTQSLDFALAATRTAGRPDNERQHAITWLRERLSAGPRAANDLKSEAKAWGIGDRTLRRAFRDLEGEAVRQGPFPFGEWKWKLPGVDGQNPSQNLSPSTDFTAQFDDYLKNLMPPT